MESTRKQPTTESTQNLPPIPMWWVSTTAPEVRLPAKVEISVTAEAVRVRAEGMGEDGNDREIEFPKSEIVAVQMVLAPEGSFADMRWAPLSFAGDFSKAIIRHVDPFGVEAYFESTFSSHRAYWLKALAKELKEKLRVEPAVEPDQQ
jgi:hypothetical protein